MSIVLHRPMRRQPTQLVPFSRDFPRPRICIVPTLGTTDIAEGRVITRGASFEGMTARAPNMIGISASLTLNTHISVPLWTNVSSEGSLLLFQQKYVNYDSTNRWLEIGATGASDHFAYNSLVYTDAFSSTRWVNGVSTTAWDVERPHGVCISVKASQQLMYMRGAVFASTTYASTFTLPANANFCGISGSQGMNGATFLIAVWDKALTAPQCAKLSNNPWALFDEAYRIHTGTVAAAAAPTLSALSAINVTASSVQPRMTYTF